MRDPVEEGFRRWLGGIWWEEKCRREEANMIDLVNGLGERGYRVTYDYLNRYIFIDEQLTITMQVARETKPEKLLQWVEMRLKAPTESPNAYSRIGCYALRI